MVLAEQLVHLDAEYVGDYSNPCDFCGEGLFFEGMEIVGGDNLSLIAKYNGQNS